MARLARVIAVGVPHHITQRGNARRFILQDETDRKVYLDLLRQSVPETVLSPKLSGFCLKGNLRFPLTFTYHGCPAFLLRQLTWEKCGRLPCLPGSAVLWPKPRCGLC
jgi:hypothetical protein